LPMRQRCSVLRARRSTTLSAARAAFRPRWRYGCRRPSAARPKSGLGCRLTSILHRCGCVNEISKFDATTLHKRRKELAGNSVTAPIFAFRFSARREASIFAARRGSENRPYKRSNRWSCHRICVALEDRLQSCAKRADRRAPSRKSGLLVAKVPKVYACVSRSGNPAVSGGATVPSFACAPWTRRQTRSRSFRVADVSPLKDEEVARRGGLFFSRPRQPTGQRGMGPVPDLRAPRTRPGWTRMRPQGIPIRTLPRTCSGPRKATRKPLECDRRATGRRHH